MVESYDLIYALVDFVLQSKLTDINTDSGSFSTETKTVPK